MSKAKITRYLKTPRNQSGFTLVEIAIVLVIVGLLLGAVLKGQELIFNTRLKSTYNLSKEMAASMYAYQDRYRMLAGDDNRATKRFPGVTPLPVDGNGNGLLTYASSYCDNPGMDNKGETCNALHHMRIAGFISGDGNEGIRNAFGGITFPGAMSTFITGATRQPGLILKYSSLTHKTLAALDSSFDDGQPQTGSIRCRTVTEYDLAKPDTNMGYNCGIEM